MSVADLPDSTKRHDEAEGCLESNEMAEVASTGMEKAGAMDIRQRFQRMNLSRILIVATGEMGAKSF